ncbi:TetR/AcrR family transcriptional regulator [Chloroflexia bacterium SDU3-3]|nr:TetR/AcrR family transcriptional regulator [Chloroflexia bacterium SDU3-3]
MTKKAPEETRAKLIQAAVAIIVGQGVAQLSLSAVAQAAQVSKGGLLHHFPTKEALLNGIDDRSTQIWRQRLDEALAKEPEGQPGRWSRAYIHACFERDPEEQELLRAIARIMSIYPPLIERWRTIYDQMWAEVGDDGLPPGRALSIQAACDGIWIGDLIEVAVIPASQLAAVRADLMRLSYV